MTFIELLRRLLKLGYTLEEVREMLNNEEEVDWM